MSHALARNFIVQTVGKILSIVLGLFTLSLLTRSLGVEAFGEYTTAVTFLQFFGVIVDFGLSLTLVVMISEPGADEERITGNVFALRMVSAAVCFGLAPLLVLAFPWSAPIKEGVLVGAIGYACMAGATMLVGIFQKHASVWRASVGELINRVVLFGLAFWFLSLGWGVVAVIWALTVANVAWLVAMLAFARPFVRVGLRFEGAMWKRIVARSWPMAVSIIFNLIYLKGDVLALALFRTQTEVGYYGAAYRVIDVLTVIPTIFMGLLLPSLVEDWKAGRRAEFGHHLQRAFDVFALLYLPMVAGVELLAVPVLGLVAGKGFEASGVILRLLILALPGVFLGVLYNHAVVAVDRQRRMLWAFVACALLCAAGYFVLIPAFGMSAAAGVTIFSEWFVALVAFLVVRRESAFRLSLGRAARALLAAAAMDGVLLLIPHLNVLVLVLIGAVSYVGFLFLFGAVDRQTLMSLMPARLAKHKTE